MDSFHAGDIALQSGLELPGAQIAYATYGRLSADRDNVVVFPTCFDGTHADNEFLIAHGRALDPERWFVIVPNMLANGLSTSPSNAPEPIAGERFPRVTHADNVSLQARLLGEVFGVERVRLVVGWSMGGQQAYHWAAMYPDAVERIAVICGAARTAPHTYVFLEGMRSALCAGGSGRPERGLRAIARAWAGWALSQAWYRRAGWEDMGYESVEDFLVRYWEEMYLRASAPDLVAQIRTWQACDIGAATGQGYDDAMRSIGARVLLMPGRTDLYFPPEDSEAEAALLRDARLSVIPSDWGHYAGGGHAEADVAFIDRELTRLLEGP